MAFDYSSLFNPNPRSLLDDTDEWDRWRTPPIFGNRPADPAPDLFPGHTISPEGADAHQSWADQLPRDSDPAQTAGFLKNVIDWTGDQGRGDAADLLGRFHKIDPDKAAALQDELHRQSGERIPFRIAPLGDGDLGPVETPPAPPETFLTPADLPQADWWGARTMAETLAKKGDYTDALTGYFLPQIAQDRDGGLTELRAAHAELGRMDPGAASLLASQFEEQSGGPLNLPAPTPNTGGGPETRNSTPSAPISGPTTAPAPTLEPSSVPVPPPPPAQEGSSPQQDQSPASQPANTPQETGQNQATYPVPPTPITGWTANKDGKAIIEAAQQAGGKLTHPAAEGCVAMVRNVVPDLGPTRTWRPGETVEGADATPIQPGTAIATFRNGAFVPVSGQGHAAIFQRYDSEGGRSGIVVVDQSKKQDTGERFFPFQRRPGERGYSAGQFSVIK
jgi:hypothetical protein